MEAKYIFAEIKEEYHTVFYLDFSLLDTAVINFVDNFWHASSDAFSADDEHFLSNDARAAELQLVSWMKLKVRNADEIFDVIFTPRKRNCWIGSDPLIQNQNLNSYFLKKFCKFYIIEK